MKTLSIVLLITSLILAGCGTATPVPIFAPATPTPPANEETPIAQIGNPICENALVFTFGQIVKLGATEDYIATLEVGDSILSGYRLSLFLADGEVLMPAGGELPEKGESHRVTWGPYVDITIVNCGRTFHYEVTKLAGAGAKPVEDPTCVPEGYSPDGLKPWPFADFVAVFAGGGVEVFLAAASDADMYLVRVRGETTEEVVAVLRPSESQVSWASIAVPGGTVAVEVISCSGNYFFRATLGGK